MSFDWMQLASWIPRSADIQREILFSASCVCKVRCYSDSLPQREKHTCISLACVPMA